MATPDPSYYDLPLPSYFRYQIHTAIVSTIAWCCMLALAISAFRAKWREDGSVSPKLRRFLLVYVVLMALASTGALIETLIGTQRMLLEPIVAFIDGSAFWDGEMVSIWAQWGPAQTMTALTPFIVFGADALMAWRCRVIYQNMNRTKTVIMWFFLITLPLSSLAMGMLTVFWPKPIHLFSKLVPSLTVGSNLILGAMIAGRIIYHNRLLNKIMGIQRTMSPFTKAVEICVESSALITICGVFMIVLLPPTPTDTLDTVFYQLSMILNNILGHVSAIASLLIIVRVENARAVVTSLSVALRRHDAFVFSRPTSVSVGTSSSAI